MFRVWLWLYGFLGNNVNDNFTLLWDIIKNNTESFMNNDSSGGPSPDKES